MDRSIFLGCLASCSTQFITTFISPTDTRQGDIISKVLIFERQIALIWADHIVTLEQMRCAYLYQYRFVT